MCVFYGKRSERGLGTYLSVGHTAVRNPKPLNAFSLKTPAHRVFADLNHFGCLRGPYF